MTGSFTAARAEGGDSMNWEFQRQAVSAWNNLPEWKRFLAIAFGKHWFLGNEQPPSFSGPAPFYLFFCKSCGVAAKDYPHGHIEGRSLIYSRCGVGHHFVPWWIPLVVLWSDLKIALRYRFSRKETGSA